MEAESGELLELVYIALGKLAPGQEQINQFPAVYDSRKLCDFVRIPSYRT